MEENKKIHFIGLADTLKPRIIFEKLKEMNFFEKYDIEFLTNSEKGLVIDYCKENNINFTVLNKGNLVFEISKIKNKKAEMLICVGWNELIPTEFLDIYKYSINCHSGLLPDYRGNRAYMHVYANIPEEYGTTIHFMNNSYDDGNIIKQTKIKLFLEETPLVIHRRICELTAFILPESINLVMKGYKGIKQKGRARFFKKISRKEMDDIRNENIERIRSGREKISTPYKEWFL